MKDTLEEDSDIKNTASSVLTALSLSKSPEMASQISSFGIGFGLSLLGHYLYTKKRGSHLARIISKILGAPIDEMNRDFVLQKMKDKEYLTRIRENILNVVETSSIDEFSKALDLSPGEAWEVYRQIKDVIIDSEIIGMISRLASETRHIESTMSAEAQSLRTAIEKQLLEVLLLREQLYEANGLSWLPRDYFEDHICTNEDIENWKNGFAFSLPSILEKKEFRRSTLINEIKGRLISRHRLLLIGESGSSKSTILMEILTDFFVDGYEILYNLDGTEIKNGPQLVSFIENRLERGDKILVVVDNVHYERTSAIFFAMDLILSSFKYTENVMFLLAARIPEYDSFVEGRLNQVGEGKESIRKYNNDNKFRYDLPFFTKDEVKGFIKKYDGKEFFLHIKDPSGKYDVSAENEKSLSNLSERIFENTRGHPIMVRFFLLGHGLRTDIGRRYSDYLGSDFKRLQAMLVCSLLHIGSLPITDELLQQIGLLREAYDLEHATLYQPSKGYWKTIHPRWDEELFSFLYNESEGGRLLDNKQYLKTALDSVFKEEKISATEERSYSVIGIIYDIAARGFIPLDIVESVISIPSYFTNEKKSELYTFYISAAYYELKKYREAIDKLDEALRLNSRNDTAYNKKGLALMKFGRYDEAVQCFDRSLEIEPNVASVWMNRGNALDDSRKYEVAINSYCKALEVEIHPIFTAEIWNNLGMCFDNLGAYEAARNSYDTAIELERYDRSLKMNANEDNRTFIEAHTWFLKGNLLHKLGKNHEAKDCYDESLKINPTDADPWLNKGICFHNLGKYKEAIQCYDKALEIDPNLARAWKAKSLALGKLGEYDDSIESYDKAQRIDPASVIDWDIFK